MATERRRLLVIGAVVVALIGVVVVLWRGTSGTPSASSNPVGRASAPGQAQKTATAGPAGVHLDALSGERPKPEAAERNLFRFKVKAPPPAPAPVRPVQPIVPAAPTGPPPPPPLPPITLKFIGIIGPAQGAKIAILSDGRNAPFYGREGAIIEGRYRILKIGVESVELAYMDGRGRQTIRLTGS